MDEEKRVIGGYEITHSIRIGEKEIVLAENKDAPPEEHRQYVCGNYKTNYIVESIEDTVFSDCYQEVALEYGQRIKAEAERVIHEIDRRKKEGISVDAITAEQCVPDSYLDCIEGKVVVLKPDILRPEFRRADNQLVLVQGGFGAQSNARGSSIVCVELYTGESMKYRRNDVMGTIKPEYMPEWAKTRLQEILARQQLQKQRHRQAQQKDRDER